MFAATFNVTFFGNLKNGKKTLCTNYVILLELLDVISASASLDDQDRLGILDLYHSSLMENRYKMKCLSRMPFEYKYYLLLLILYFVMSVVESEIGRSSRRFARSGTSSTPPLIIEILDCFLPGELFSLEDDI